MSKTMAEHAREYRTRKAERIARMEAALKDMLSGWVYIRQQHGDLYGVAWDRCENAARNALAKPTKD